MRTVTPRWGVYQSLAAVATWAMVATVVVWALASDRSVGLFGAVCAGMLFVAFWGHPRVAFVVWMLALVMVPIWISIDLFATVPAHCVIAILAVLAALRHGHPKVTKFDAYFALLLAVSFATVLFGGSSGASWGQILLRWGIPFFAVRVLINVVGTRFVVDVIAVLLGVVGGLALLEFLLAWHPFVGLDIGSPEFKFWHSIQFRDGIARSEWAFGHSIALGGSLALSIPFIARSSYRMSTKAVLLVAISAGILTTASRSALIGAGLTAAICLLYAAKPVARTAVLTTTLVVAFLASFFVGPLVQTWARGRSEEAQSSFDYRNSLYSTYLPSVEWFGRSPKYLPGQQGFYSTDSAFLRLALEFGWIVLLLAVLPLVVSMLRVLGGRASFAEIAIVGQIPIFATVALITQYESLVFVVAGIAVQMINAPAADPWGRTRNTRFLRAGSPSDQLFPNTRYRDPSKIEQC